MKGFLFDGREQPVIFVETIKIPTGEECDVYKFENDPSKDLRVIRMKPGGKTPLQKILKGDKTLEGYVSGKGKLTITKSDGEKAVYQMTGEPFVKDVQIGECMQWEADEKSELVAYEICFPPYEDGRYENIG
jgi:hypothetical protein